MGRARGYYIVGGFALQYVFVKGFQSLGQQLLFQPAQCLALYEVFLAGKEIPARGIARLELIKKFSVVHISSAGYAHGRLKSRV